MPAMAGEFLMVAFDYYVSFLHSIVVECYEIQALGFAIIRLFYFGQRLNFCKNERSDFKLEIQQRGFPYKVNNVVTAIDAMCS